MKLHLSRRQLLLAGTSALLAGCVQRDGRPLAGPAHPGTWYVVLQGDTLASVSLRSGVPIDDIIDANHLEGGYIAPGMQIFLPSPTQTAQRSVPYQSPPPVDQATPFQPEAPPSAVEEQPSWSGSYEIVPRSAWTSQPIAGNNRLMNGVTRITIHHTGEHAGLVGLPDIEVIQRIEKYHRNEKHWAAIGYHYIVGRDGRIYEGRPVRYQGAHVLSENANNLGISVIGDFQVHLPNPRQLVALRAFLNDSRTRYHVPVSRVYGHRDLNRSICPGDALYGWLCNRYKVV
jgi:hypothetical protein